MSDAVHSNLLLTIARAIHPLVSPEHQKHIDAAVKDWPHAKAFLEEEVEKHEAGKPAVGRAEAPRVNPEHRSVDPQPNLEPTDQRRGPPTTRRSQSAADF
jgi:hypothetical protein